LRALNEEAATLRTFRLRERMSWEAPRPIRLDGVTHFINGKFLIPVKWYDASDGQAQ